MVGQKDGRRNRYQIRAHPPLPEGGAGGLAIGEILALLAGTRPASPDSPAEGLCVPRISSMALSSRVALPAVRP